MGRGIGGAMLRGFGGRDHLATVEQTEHIAPHCVRITMSSPTVFDDVDGEASGVRVGPDERVGALELGASAVGVGKPEPQPGRWPGVDVVEHGR